MTKDEVLTALQAEIALAASSEARVKDLTLKLGMATTQALESAARVKALHAQLLDVMKPTSGEA